MEQIIEIHAQLAPMLDEIERLKKAYGIDFIDISLGHGCAREFYVERRNGKVTYHHVDTRNGNTEWRSEVEDDTENV